VFPNGQTYDEYLFGYHSPLIPGSRYRGYSSPEAYYLRGNPDTVVVNPFAALIREYQRYAWMPGTVYGLVLAVGLFGVVLRWRRAGRDALLPWLCSVALIVAPAATAEFDYRYVTTAVPFACLAAAMAFGWRARDEQPDGTAGTRAASADAVTPGGLAEDGAGGESGGAPLLPRRVPGGGLSGGLADAGHHKRDLAADAT
jgi:hypothetical protein